MNYSEDYDDQGEWEKAYEQAQDHLEHLLTELVSDMPKLTHAKDANDMVVFNFLGRLDDAKAIAKFIANGDAFGYAERFIGDLSENGDY